MLPCCSPGVAIQHKRGSIWKLHTEVREADYVFQRRQHTASAGAATAFAGLQTRMLGSMLLQGSAMAPSAACQGRLARQSTVVQGTVLHPACLHRCPAPGRRRRHRACYAAAIPAGAASAQAEMHQELREAAAAGAQQHNGATTAAEVEQAIQREPEPSAQFDWNKQWYPISWMKWVDGMKNAACCAASAKCNQCLPVQHRRKWPAKLPLTILIDFCWVVCRDLDPATPNPLQLLGKNLCVCWVDTISA